MAAMIVSAIRPTDPEWTRERQLLLPLGSGHERKERPRRRSRRGGEDSIELSPQLELLLLEEVLERIWHEVALPTTRSRSPWGRSALAALLGDRLAAAVTGTERRSLLHAPRTFADFQLLAEALSLH